MGGGGSHSGDVGAGADGFRGNGDGGDGSLRPGVQIAEVGAELGDGRGGLVRGGGWEDAAAGGKSFADVKGFGAGGVALDELRKVPRGGAGGGWGELSRGERGLGSVEGLDGLMGGVTVICDGGVAGYWDETVFAKRE